MNPEGADEFGSAEKLEIYLDASSNMRHYGNMRFAQLTLFSAASGALIGATILGEPERTLGIAIAVGGILIAIVLWVMEERAASFFHHYRSITVGFEEELGFEQHRTRPEGRHIGTLITSANAVRFLYAGAIVFWAILLVGFIAK